MADAAWMSLRWHFVSDLENISSQQQHRQGASHRLQPTLAGVQLNEPCVSQRHMQRSVGAGGALGSLVLLTHSGNSDVTLSACFQLPRRLLNTLFIYLSIYYLFNRGDTYNTAARMAMIRVRTFKLTLTCSLCSLSGF